MKKLKWQYDKKNKEWYLLDSTSYDHDGYSIVKEYSKYKLSPEVGQILYFNKLSSAKKVVELIING